MKENKLGNIIKSQAIWVVFIVLCVGFTIANPRFITATNLLIMLRQVAVWGIASVGMTFVILLGDIDLATGSVITFVNVLCSYLMVHMGVPMALAIIITLAASTLIGILNGFMVSTIGIPALIATFATQTAFSGIALIICDGQPINGFTESFKVFGQGKVGPVPVPVIIMIICFALGAFILNKTYFGRYFYAVGGNIEAARLSGIRTGRVKYLVFALSGFFAGLAGLVLLSRVNSGMGNASLGYEFKVITCVVLGGVSVSGGSGRMSGVVAGTFIISALNNGMVLINLNSWVQNIVLGIVLVLAVGFDCYQKKRQAN
ncbi:ribose ABC transporter permease [Lachnospiraceae bacterium WCA-9-b2]|uniref:Ribose ABC transporter permease n=1 Tax=Sporofaciens musculi TaxID=2681861 RepID=A0A7X3ME88_9FIRM|nr:ABC transporter permease [Sporofaciens musculi]MXP74819.1 ribose ABC transporter permease [Sporofaciens musculi]